MFILVNDLLGWLLPAFWKIACSGFLGAECSAHVYTTCCISGTGLHEGQIFKGPWISHKCYTKAAFPKN